LHYNFNAASIYKQRFGFMTGHCLDDKEGKFATYQVELDEGKQFISCFSPFLK
jgi:nitrite reductase/ring-hydroxylating ferredoxin subunit